MTVDLRCSPQARAHGGATGTASPAWAHVLVEIPLPWPADLGATAELEAVAAVTAGPGIRFHGVVPQAPVVADQVRVVVHVADQPNFRAYRRHATTVARAEVPDAVQALLAGAHEQPGTDVLVCSHGARDRCCGSMGTALALRSQAVDRPATGPAATQRNDRADSGQERSTTASGTTRPPDPGGTEQDRWPGRPGPGPSPGPIVWRSGHLGGHRFAPTALVLPSGTVWAWLDDELLAAVVNRSRPPMDLRDHYRGSTAVAHRAAQLAEAEVFCRVGWSWLDARRTAEVVGEPVPGTEWEVRVTGGCMAWRGLVREIGRLRQPACGSAEAGPKDDPILELVELCEER
jgi:hypothetical protein